MTRRQDKTSEAKTRQDKTKQNKTKQNKTITRQSQGNLDNQKTITPFMSSANTLISSGKGPSSFDFMAA